MKTRARRPWLLGLAVLLAEGVAFASMARGDSFYYQTEEDGSISLTNAPDDRRYHAFMSTGGSGGAPTGRYSEQIRRESGRYGLDPNLVEAVIATESNFNPWAVSPKGARGLMQLMPGTAQRFGVKNVHDPSQNIQGGVQYLRYLLDLFGGDLVLALAAYNAGEGVVQSLGRVPNYQETRQYVDRVLARYGQGIPSRAMKAGGRKAMAARPKPQIYSTVSQDGTLVFSDTPISKVVKD
ncbi:MAG: lytic transglycosylase domain-containing protein [Acidobacteria bacterium]|nr:lytic transglycosylase domain-containing protein [Acidobacteriota bacterium]MCI0566762.1 lytic transglycosylase domain-containing protein [Acidobacteriota bacterium]